MKKLASLLVVGVLAVGISAATAAAVPKASSGSNTIVDVAASNKSFSTLVALVQKAGLADTLSAAGPYTVFAPTNAAFAKLKRQAPKTYKAVVNSKKLLTKVLTYHVLAGKVDAKAAIAGAKQHASVKTVQGERIGLSLKNGALYLNGSSKVVTTNIKASNGIIHVINTVLIPPSLR